MHIERRYIDAADVAKMIRAALKDAFPGTVFSVRTSKYSGGASVDVSYVDGPPIEATEAIARRYAGSYFDGMIDYQGSVYHLFDGEPVRLGANFVFVSRNLSADALRAGLAAFEAAGAASERVGALEVEERTDWRGRPAAHLVGERAQGQLWGADRRPYYGERAIATWFDHGRDQAELQPRSMREVFRLQIAGDDGYSAQCGSGISHAGAIDFAQVAAERSSATVN